MALTSSKMGLRIWNLLGDLFDHDQLADNWAKVDLHDHSPGRGVQIPTEGIADGAITGPKLATALDSSGAYTSYKSLGVGQAYRYDAPALGAYIVLNSNGAGVAATAATAGLGAFWIDPADFAASGRSVVFRNRSILLCNATAPGGNIAVDIRPVTGILGATASVTLTLGAALSGSVSTFTAPAASTGYKQDSTDFTVTTPGFYAFVMTNSQANTAASSFVVRSDLFVRQV